MSVGISNVPPWKRALLERKRSNEEGDSGGHTNEEGNRVSSLPSWKRDILSKKSNTKNSFVFLSEKSQASGNAKPVQDSVDSKVLNSKEPDEPREMPTSPGKENGEHLPELKQNPWLRADSSHTKKGTQSHRLSDSLIDRRSNNSSNHSCSETDGSHVTQNSHAVINNEEEVTYGKGFVHKLLKKFSLMSYKDEEEPANLHSSSKGRISRSTENLLDSKLDYSSRSFSPQGRSNESLSPRSHSLSQSSDTLPSPRVVLNESGSSSSGNHKMGFEDKAGTISPEVFIPDHGSISLDNLSPTVLPLHNDSTDNCELPKRNTVASARSVFESYASHSDNKGQDISPRSPRSPRIKSVHSLIAVDRFLSSKGDQTLTYDEANTEKRESSGPSNISASSSSAKLVVLSPKINSDTSQQSRSKFFPSSTQGSASKDTSKKSSSGQFRGSSNNGMDTQGHSNKSLHNGKSLDQSSTAVNSRPVYASVDVVNGQMNGKGSEDPLERVESPFKKRKAPGPVRVQSDVQNDRKKHVTSVEVTNSVSTIKNVPVKPENVSKVSVNSSQLKRTEKKAGSTSDKPDTTQSEVTTKYDGKRQNLSLKLGKVEADNVKASKVNSSKVERPHITPKSNPDRKAKFKVPTSTGPGSLLIRPASNLVQGKDAKFVSLEFKYNDIKTGDFAPAKKKPAYYDEYSDDSEEEDILVTNIDDVIEGQTPALQKDANANVSKQKKWKKYDFVGQGVVLSKSSLRTRKAKLTLRFDEVARTTYEYPSQRFLLNTMSPEPGDFDHPDTPFNDVTTPSDEDIPDMEEPSTTLKATPALSSSSSSMAGYQSKMQVDFHFGMDPIVADPGTSSQNGSAPSRGKQATGSGNNTVRPAEEDDTVHWSENSTSDLLF